MNESIHCRESTDADLPGILRLYGQPAPDDGEALAVAEARTIFQRIGSYPNYRLFEAVCEGEIVGTFALLIMDHLIHWGAPSAVIEAVAVDPFFQGRGIGTVMMKDALDRSRQAGCYKAMVSSNLIRERAHAFYESLGFERHGYSFRVNTEHTAAADA
jgi:GNAT superfamily N-acetyltransferase